MRFWRCEKCSLQRFIAFAANLPLIKFILGKARGHAVPTVKEEADKAIMALFEPYAMASWVVSQFEIGTFD